LNAKRCQPIFNITYLVNLLFS